MNANDLDKLVTDRMRDFDLVPLMPHFDKVPDGQKMEVLDQTGRANRYYQWIACLIQLTNPKQFVELGTSIGTSAIMICTQLAKDAKLYTVDNGHDYGEGMRAFEAIKEDYPQLVKIWGDDLDLTIYDKVGCDLKKTDILFIDTEHKAEQLRKELDLYLPLLKPKTIVILDDIRLNDMYSVWDSLKYDKCENTNPCHYSGFGFFVV